MQTRDVLLPSLSFFQPRPEARISKSGDGKLRAEIAGDHLAPLCEGHFPDFAVVPGAHLFAAMYDFVVSCGAETEQPGPFVPVSCVFRGLARPTRDLRLDLSSSPDALTVTAFQDGADWIARGRVESRTRQMMECESPATIAVAIGMDGRAAVSSLAHRPPALLLECALGDDTRGRACFRATSLSHWSWPQLMDAAAQAAGLVAKRQLPDTKGILVVVAYDQVELADMNTPIERTLSQCPIELRVRMVRTIRNLLQLEVLGVQCLPMADQPLLRLKVTLAPLPTESRT